MSLNNAWAKVQESKTLHFITKGRIVFKPVKESFPKQWKENSSVNTKMLLFGFIPFGGVHTIKFVEINQEKKQLVTNEKNTFVKVWNHTICMTSKDDNHILYTDEITIYAGIFTKLVALWATSFYKYRQKRWLLLAK